ncbi:MAG: signal recognition particle-docking protein FtsY, partial [Alphaproteobacteria bacterium]
IRLALAEQITAILRPGEVPLEIDTSNAPHVILVVGVNGSGKTTTIGKLSQHFTDGGHKVLLAAGDTFRAAAIEQLKIWSDRTGSEIVAKEQGSDAAALAFEAIARAKETGADIVLLDTAGRLHNKTDLMDELSKVVRVIKKVQPDAPHDTLLILDATTGQNALSQVEIFRKTADITGLIVTKLDGTAKGGVMVALADKFGLPVHAIGVGETAADLQPFDAEEFAQALTGVEAGDR